MRSVLLCAGLIASVSLSGCGGADAEPILGSGLISVVSTRNGTQAGASYRRFWGGGEDCPAERQVGGSCVAGDCSYDLDELPPLISAGTITVTGGLEEVSLTPLEDGSYDPFLVQGPVFEGGEELHFEVSGDREITAAAGSLVAPSFVSVIEPSLPDLTEIDRDRDLNIRWSPRSEGNVVVSASLRSRSGSKIRTVSLYCAFSGGLGAASLSSNDLKWFPQSSDGDEGTLWIGSQVTGFDWAGSWEHVFLLTAYESASVEFR